ncbi:ThiF family adenylyltransferase [Halorussus salilacus]|uniref:HesA/MoeB/ThiF family protein n=1 Tax=Halorussus salilacus TaxID=2953750 RepID=UPI0020A202BA|nr:ThiF family adenylyltransferase [Halorussus salilacus]USZ68532.1 ThiF family adenylyltransferase [Halorussus salilacus]
MPDRLVVSAGQMQTLREHLLQEDAQERCAYGFCTRSGDRWVVADIVAVPDEAMRTQRRTACRPAPAFERDQLGTCVRHGYRPLLMHSHPFSDTAGFSGQDITAINRYTNWLHGLYPETDFGFSVVGRREVETTVFEAAAEQFHPVPVDVVGNWRLDPPVATATDTAAIDADLHDRSLRLLTEPGQQRLAATTVAVVGTGGLGFSLTKQLARLGVQHLVLIDPDTVERSNLNRLTGATVWDVGRQKVTVLAQQLHDTGLDLTVETVPDPVEDATDALTDCDVVVGTVDQVSTRSVLNQYCVRHLRYYIDAGTVIRTADEEQVTAIEGIVQLVAPGASACYACLDRADPERARREQLSTAQLDAEVAEGYIEESALAPDPAVVTLNGTIASQAAAVFARLAAGYASPPDMVRYEELDTQLQELVTHRDSSCPTCGEEGLLGQGDRDPAADRDLGDPADSDLDLAISGGDTATDGGTPVAGTRRPGQRLVQWLTRISQQVRP